MHARQTREQKGANFTNIGKGQMLPLTSMVKRHNVMACNQLGSSVRLSHLAPHLGGVVASIGTLNRAGAYTLARACASALQTCLSTNTLTQQAFDPLVNHAFFETSGSTCL
jgi:hypothetical protein